MGSIWTLGTLLVHGIREIPTCSSSVESSGTFPAFFIFSGIKRYTSGLFSSGGIKRYTSSFIFARKPASCHAECECDFSLTQAGPEYEFNFGSINNGRKLLNAQVAVIGGCSECEFNLVVPIASSAFHNITPLDFDSVVGCHFGWL